MPKYIDAGAFKNDIMTAMVAMSERDGSLPIRLGILISDLVDDAPTEDVVPVVRCKDCEHCEQTEKGYLKCSITDDMVIKPDGFCSYGKKRGDEQCL